MQQPTTTSLVVAVMVVVVGKATLLIQPPPTFGNGSAFPLGGGYSPGNVYAPLGGAFQQGYNAAPLPLIGGNRYFQPPQGHQVPMQVPPYLNVVQYYAYWNSC